MVRKRFKTTPTRMQNNDNFMVATATATKVIVPNDMKKRYLHQSLGSKEKLQVSSTITSPKRTNSISSAVSDTQSSLSETESPSIVTKTNVPDGLQSLHCESMTTHNRNRKIFMITEKSKTDNSDTANKRKIFLVIDEEEKTLQNETDEENSKKLKSENGKVAIAPKKLMLYASKSDDAFTREFTNNLPKILNCIQAKRPTVEQEQKLQQIQQIQQEPSQNESDVNNIELYRNDTNDNKRLPITLPPKKNRNKITSVTTPMHNNNNNYSNIDLQYRNNTIQLSAATPVIVSAASLNQKNKQANHQETQRTPEHNINLSTDFLFLMKILPKLENIPEPHKSYVKTCIERIIAQ